MKNYIIDINLQDDMFFLHYDNGKVKSIPFAKYDDISIKRIISIFSKEIDVLKEVKERLKLFLLLNIIASFLIIVLSVIVYRLFSISIITDIITIITGVDFSLINLISMDINYHQLDEIKKTILPSVNNQVEILNQELIILEENKKNPNIIKIEPYHKKKNLINNYNLNPDDIQNEENNCKILTLRKGKRF